MTSEELLQLILNKMTDQVALTGNLTSSVNTLNTNILQLTACVKSVIWVLGVIVALQLVSLFSKAWLRNGA